MSPLRELSQDSKKEHRPQLSTRTSRNRATLFLNLISQMGTQVWLVQRHRIWDGSSGPQEQTGEKELNVTRRVFKQMQKKPSSLHLLHVQFQSLHPGSLNTGLVLLLLFREYLEISRKRIWGQFVRFTRDIRLRTLSDIPYFLPQRLHLV